MLKQLDEILLSDNAREMFYQNYQNQEFKNWILSILPEIELCKNQKQDNPWHIYDCLDHILHSVEEMNNQTRYMDFETRKMLAYTMFLHDIGKPQCYFRRYSNLYGRYVDSFFNHNLVSEKIAERVLPKLEFNKKQSNIICLLVKEHDLFMNLTLEDDGNKYHIVLTQQYLDKLFKKFNVFCDGKKLLNFLVMVGRADNLAQNPKMTKESLKKIDIFENMLKKERAKNEIDFLKT